MKSYLIARSGQRGLRYFPLNSLQNNFSISPTFISDNAIVLNLFLKLLNHYMITAIFIIVDIIYTI